MSGDARRRIRTAKLGVSPVAAGIKQSTANTKVF